MTTGLARASVRARPTAFAGVFSVLVLSAAVVTASVAMLRTAGPLPSGPQREAVTAMGAGFTVVTCYLSVFVIAQVMALTVAARARENAVLRAVGALPWQIRRAVATEALCTALPALPVGYGLGCVLAYGWRDGMVAHGLLPSGVPLVVGWPPALAAGGVLLVTSQLGGLLAAHRAARARPADALGEAAGARSLRSSGWLPGLTLAGAVRGLGAVLAVSGAVALTAVTAAGPREDVGEHLPLVLLAYLVGVGCAGPVIGRAAARLLAGPMRLLTAPRALGGGAAAELAFAQTRAAARRLSAAVTPVALVVAFSLVKSAALAAVAEPSWIDLFATVLYAAFAACAAANTMVLLSAERRPEVALLRAIGAAPGQVARMLVVEALTVACAGFGAGAAVAFAVTLPLGDAAGASLSALPPTGWAAAAGGVLVLALAATLAPLPGQLRRAPG
ncbi:ABC transporter permease [Streptomyces qinglanensis]|uniref:Putative ABC transport system permease protein n=1 Tax=Streptomyces qinglanensis TaxID=943816 RepID=A0A1H9PUK4_9ACTN|nr:ABC transporter permease [Streptomyces qinglanensis]SER51469.1 putative ABC transport system permease protein [Streptomyces qinglanensis]